LPLNPANGCGTGRPETLGPQVRTMAFVDFESIQQATNALTRMQALNRLA
jgi:hypothetical protein